VPAAAAAAAALPLLLPPQMISLHQQDTFSLGCLVAELWLANLSDPFPLSSPLLLRCLQDVFSLGCVIAELWLDGRAFLDLSRLLLLLLLLLVASLFT
jgi:hypothetical protein